MEQRPLGRTGLSVSALCLGTMTFGNQNTEAEGHAQMDCALGEGVTFFDTAEMYPVPPSEATCGRTESIVGTWFATRKTRDKVILATKVAGAGLPWIRGGEAGIDRRNIVSAVEGSLKRLKTDYIDLYQLHWPNRATYHFESRWDFKPGDVDRAQVEDNMLEVLRTLGDLVRAGTIRHVGLSNETAWGAGMWLALAEKHALPRMASIQNEYSLLCRTFDWDLAEMAVYEDIGLLAWSPLATGLLSGKYDGGARPPGSRWSLEGRVLYRDTPRAHAAVEAYGALARAQGMDPCQMAIAFVTSRPFVTSTIIGATNLDQLKVNIAAARMRLNENILFKINEIRKDFPAPY
ncbi:MAG TPA: aldo/keto reductase [Alphaproteobacteria bacterium]|nr:aldo/keto reductase [Alphaproteobacteria bacterium]